MPLCSGISMSFELSPRGNFLFCVSKKKTCTAEHKRQKKTRKKGHFFLKTLRESNQANLHVRSLRLADYTRRAAYSRRAAYFRLGSPGCSGEQADCWRVARHEGFRKSTVAPAMVLVRCRRGVTFLHHPRHRGALERLAVVSTLHIIQRAVQPDDGTGSHVKN